MAPKRKQRPLTSQEAKALQFIADTLRKQGYPPTTRELGGHLGVNHVRAFKILNALHELGHIRKEPGRIRAIHLTAAKAAPDLFVEAIRDHMLDRKGSAMPAGVAKQIDAAF